MAVGCGVTAATTTHTHENPPAVRSPDYGLCRTAILGASDSAAIARPADNRRVYARSNSPAVAPETEPREGTYNTSANSAGNPPAQDFNGGTVRQRTDEPPPASPDGDEPDAPGLLIVSANVQKSRENTTVLLDRHRDADIICVQEPCWTYVKHIASSTSKDGDPTFHTVHHKNFITLGASEKSRVVTYVHRERWESASPRVRLACLNHRDAICVTLSTAEREFSFLNIYNDPREFSALTELINRANDLPPLAFVAGDFNIRHPMWDPVERKLDVPGRRHLLRHVTQGRDLITLTTDYMGLVLANDPNGPPTWYSNDLGVREGVLDLVWVDPDLGPIPSIDVDDLGRHDSDHAVLTWRLPLQSTHERSARLAHGSAQGDRFVRICRQRVNDIARAAADDYTSRADVERVAECVGEAFREAWQLCAEVPRPSKRSKTWWNRECSNIAAQQRQRRLELKDFRHRRTAAQKNLRSARGEMRAQCRHEIAHLTHLMHASQAHIRALSKKLKGAIRRARNAFYNGIIRETDPARVWSLVDWTKPRRMDATTVLVKANGEPIENQNELGDAFQDQFTPANPQPIDQSLLDEVDALEERDFPDFSRQELREALAKTSNFSAPGPDHVSWFWLKQILSPDRADSHDQPAECEGRVLDLFNACIKFGVHPKLFKTSKTVVIPKPKKPDYSKAKAYRPIVLLNCIGKLLEKLISRRLQFDAQQHGILHPCQFGGAVQHSTIDAGVHLVHNVKQAWRQGMDSSALLLDVAQFFPSINHGMLAAILRKQGFSPALCSFFEDYLIDRQTQFQFNGVTLPPRDFSTGVGQGSSLSPILTGLFLAPILHRIAPTHQTLTLQTSEGPTKIRHDWTPRQLAANGHATLQFFVDDGLIHVAGKLAPGAEPEDQLKYNVTLLQAMYEKLATYLSRAGLQVEADKLELMHFRHRRQKTWSAAKPLGPSMKVKHNGKQIVIPPAAHMRYLGFYLDPTLSFKEHVRFYSTKGCSTVQTLRMLGNSRRGMDPEHRRTLYRSNVVPVITYGAQLWWTPNWKGRKGFAKTLQQPQSRAARWITGAFRTTPIGATECFAGLLPVKNQIDQLMKRSCLRIRTLHPGHPTRAILPADWKCNTTNITAPLPMRLTKRHLANTPATHIHTIASTLCQEDFDALSPECRPGSRVVDQLGHRIHTFMAAPKKGSSQYAAWLRNEFKPRLAENMADERTRVLFSDGSVIPPDNGHRASSGAGYVVRDIDVRGRERLTQGWFGCGNVTPYDAEVLALARGLKIACTNIPENVTHLRVYTDNKAALAKILDPSIGPSQMGAILAAKHVRTFLGSRQDRIVELHWCPGHQSIRLNDLVDALAKNGATGPQPAFTSLARARQNIREEAEAAWREAIQVKTYRGRQTMLADSDDIQPSANNWYLRSFGHHPREMARFTRFASGHFPCGAYRERFKLPGPTMCWTCNCLETREHILWECPAWTRGKELAAGATMHGDRRSTQVAGPVLRRFLRTNPMVGTFAWGDIVQQATQDRDRGLTTQSSMAMCKAHAHSLGRTAERRLWMERRMRRARAYGDKVPSELLLEDEFDEWYAAKMASHISKVFWCAGQKDEIRREFGGRSRATPAGQRQDKRHAAATASASGEAGSGGGGRSRDEGGGETTAGTRRRAVKARKGDRWRRGWREDAVA